MPVTFNFDPEHVLGVVREVRGNTRGKLELDVTLNPEGKRVVQSALGFLSKNGIKIEWEPDFITLHFEGLKGNDDGDGGAEPEGR